MVGARTHAARLWKALPGGRVQCRLCAHFCLVEPGARGLCGVRLNEGGELKTLVYALPAALAVDPVEKKPLYHFLPGTPTFSLGTQGCNFACSFCQNDSLSQPPRLGEDPRGHAAGPQDIVRAALGSAAKSISYTYSEPTVFYELVEDTARLALRYGLKNVLVTNGYMSPDCLQALGPAKGGLIQAANVDLKAFGEDFYRERCGARLGPVLENLKRMRALGWWIEVTTLVIPGLNDGPAELSLLAGFIARELGPDTPWHISRFHPAYRLADRPPTPEKTLLLARDLGRAAGLRNVYIGNAAGQGYGDTLCPGCGAAVIRRAGFRCDASGLNVEAGGACRACGARLPGVWS